MLNRSIIKLWLFWMVLFGLYITSFWFANCIDNNYNLSLKDREYISKVSNETLLKYQKADNKDWNQTEKETLAIAKISDSISSKCISAKTKKDKKIRYEIYINSMYEWPFSASLQNYKWYYLRQINKRWGKTSQSINDKNGKYIKWTQLFKNIPNTLYIWNIKYQNPQINFDDSTIFTCDSDIIKNNKLSLCVGVLNNKIAIQVNKSPDIYFTYTSSNFPKTNSSNRLDWNYQVIKNSDFDLKWRDNILYDINNKTITNSLLSRDGWFGVGNTKNTYSKFTGIDSKKLPIFQFYKVWDYSIIWLKSWYYPVTPDGLGKPVIYIYDKLSRSNAVSIITSWEVIYNTPSFTNVWSNSWSFIWQPNGKPIINNTTYDYLYYKLLVWWYIYENTGFIVSGNQIWQLFQNQLSNIWLNLWEINDFRSYRDNKFTQNKSYFIWFKTNLDSYIQLDRDIQPNKILRVIMESTEIDNNFDYDNKTILQTDSNIYSWFDRNENLVVVERWWSLRWSNYENTFIK